MKFIKRIIPLMILGVLVTGPHAVRSDPGLILTVGPGGNHSTIQAAINAALSSLNNSPIEIRVATGNHLDNIGIPAAMDHGSVNVGDTVDALLVVGVGHRPLPLCVKRFQAR